MFRKQKDSVKVADLIIFCNEKDSQQYLVFDLKYGDNIIGKNSSLCSIVLSFTKEIDDVHTKISIEDDDYTIEDLGSQKGTFKIKSDNSLIRLKPNKSYDLSNNHIFYIGKYKCKFQIVKPGRAMAFSLSPTDILNSQKNNSNTSVHQNANINNRKGSKKVQSYEDDIEDSTDLPSKQQHKKNQIASKMIQNRLEAENIDEEEDEKHFQKINNNKAALASSVAQSKKATNTQKNFVKSKGQLAKGIKGTFKNGQSDEDQDLKKEDIYDITDTQLYKVSDEEEEDCEFQFSFPKSFKKNNNQDEEQPTRKRAASNRKNNGVQAQQQKHDEDEMKLDSQFLKRIQDKLKSNTEINEQRKVINDLAQKYSSQKNTQKQSQDIPFDDKKEKQASLEKKESEDYWSPSTLKRKNTNKAEATSNKNKSKTLNKEVKNETEASKVEAPSKKIWKEKEQISKQDPTNKKNSKKQEEDQEQEEEQQEPKKKEVTSKSKKDLKLKYKNEDKMEKLKQQAENVLNTIKNSSNQSKKQDHESADKSKTKQKDKTKSKTFDDSTSISNNDNDEDEEYSIEEEEDMQSQSQKIAKAISTRKRKYDDLMTQQTKQETNKNSKSKEQIPKQIVNDKEKTKTTDTNKTETDSKGKNSDAKKKHSKETPQAKNSKETKASEEQKKSKPQNNKQQKNELQDKQVDKIKEEKPASLRRSTRKNQIEEEEKEEKITKKSVTKTVQKASAKKSTSKKQSKKENSDEGEEEENQMEIEEPKSNRKIARKSILKAQSVDNSQQNEDQISKDQSKKSRRSEKNTVKSKKETQKPKSLIRRTLGSKKEALLLQQSAGIIMDIPRRNKFRIIFSNSSITDEEKKQMSTYGVKILNEFHSANDFNILVTDEFKRRLKTLVALNKGYPIISQNWIKECIKEDKIVPYESFVITKVDKALAKQHNFELKKSINNQKDHPEGILHGLTFVCQNSFDNLNKEEVRKLVESAGGSFLYEKPKNTSAYFLSDPSKSEYNKQQNESNEIVLDIEGLLQTCLLQFNVLGNYIITSSAKEKKSTKKK